MKISALWKAYFTSPNVITRTALGVGIVIAFGLNYAFSDPITFFQRLELQAYDTRLRTTMPEKIDPRVVIIDIDEKSLAAEGRWPWGRDKIARLVSQLFDTYKIKVVGFDVIFTEADTSSGLKTLEQLSQSAFKSNPEFQEKFAELKPSLDFDRRLADEIKKHPVVLAFAGQNERAGSAMLGLGVLPQPTFTTGSFNNREFVSMTIDGYSGNLPTLQKSATATGHILPLIDFDGVLRRIPVFVRYKDGFYESLS
ncbi:MAG: CHASE2 domain-containing protein, partial [Betaproteobacteria bacterium]|nr:CHASE2 domain-containing protein [Betaproteobacteria bacterium]